MRVALFGATGMIGGGTLIECLVLARKGAHRARTARAWFHASVCASPRLHPASERRAIEDGVYQAFYIAVAPLSPLIQLVLPGLATTTSALGCALIQLGLRGFARPIVTTRDINRLAAAA